MPSLPGLAAAAAAAAAAAGSFPEDEARALLRQLLSALAYCHALGVVHRDLKPENVLFENDEEQRVASGQGVGSLKLIDFGYAALHKPGERLRGLSGTPDYVAPEVLSWYEGDDADAASKAAAYPGGGVEYDASCDMWSIGVMLFIMLCGFPPFYAEAEPELIQRVREGNFEFTSPYWDDISDGAKDLIARCLSLAPEDRPTPTEALRHPWVANATAAAPEVAEAPASAPPRGADARAARAAMPLPTDDDDGNEEFADAEEEAVNRGGAASSYAYGEEEEGAVAHPGGGEAEEEEEYDDDFDDKSDASPPARQPQARQPPAREPPAREPQARTPGGGGPAGGQEGHSSVERLSSMQPGELVARIRKMRQSYAPGHPMQARSGAPGAPGLQFSVDGGASEPQVASAPSREALEAQGATFVKVPRSLFQDIYALLEAQRRGELPETGERPVSEIIQALSAQVQRGELGTML